MAMKAILHGADELATAANRSVKDQEQEHVREERVSCLVRRLVLVRGS
jgi:hypothetical protein